MHATLKNYRSQGSDSTGKVLARQMQETELGLLHPCKNWARCAPFKIPELGKEKQEISWGSHELAYWISKLQARVSSCLKKKTKWTAPEEWQVRLFSACPTPTLMHVPTHAREEREGIINPWSLLFSYNLRISKNEDVYGYLSGCLSPSLLHFIPQK